MLDVSRPPAQPATLGGCGEIGIKQPELLDNSKNQSENVNRTISSGRCRCCCGSGTGFHQEEYRRRLTRAVLPLLFLAISIVNLGYYLAHGQPPLLAEGGAFALFGILAYSSMEQRGFSTTCPSSMVRSRSLRCQPPILQSLSCLLEYFWQVSGHSDGDPRVHRSAYHPTGGEGKKRVHLRWIPLAMGALLLWGVTDRFEICLRPGQMRRRCRSTQSSADF